MSLHWKYIEEYNNIAHSITRFAPVDLNQKNLSQETIDKCLAFQHAAWRAKSTIEFEINDYGLIKEHQKLFPKNRLEPVIRWKWNNSNKDFIGNVNTIAILIIKTNGTTIHFKLLDSCNGLNVGNIYNCEARDIIPIRHNAIIDQIKTGISFKMIIENEKEELPIKEVDDLIFDILDEEEAQDYLSL